MNLTGSANTVAWFCFALGGVVFLAGAVLGFVMSWKETTTGTSAKETKTKVNAALKKVEGLKDTAEKAANSAAADPAAHETAKSTGSDVESTLKEIEGIIGALPERLRFAAVLILIGSLLMSVATVQFGGHAIF